MKENEIYNCDENLINKFPETTQEDIYSNSHSDYYKNNNFSENKMINNIIINKEDNFPNPFNQINSLNNSNNFIFSNLKNLNNEEELLKNKLKEIKSKKTLKGLTSLNLNRHHSKMIVNSISNSIYLYDPLYFDKYPPAELKGHKSSYYVKSVL